MRVPGRNTALTTLRWLKSRWRSRILVLGYHRISGTDQDHRGLAVSPARFEQQMEVLARITHTIALRDVPRCLSGNGSAKPAVVVTFDDGYADNLHTALPVLERLGIPATFFIVSDYLGREFWWDELDRLDTGSGPLPAESELLACSDEQRRSILDGVARRGRWCSASPLHRALTAEELRRTAENGLIEIGSHGATHRLLPVLPIEEQRRELRASRQVLETLVGGPVTSFSYPHGGSSTSTAALVSETGFVLACCSTPEVVTPQSDVFALPRFWAGEWGPDRFERFLRRWLLD